MGSDDFPHTTWEGTGYGGLETLENHLCSWELRKEFCQFCQKGPTGIDVKEMEEFCRNVTDH